MIFPPPWVGLVLQNQRNIFFPSKGWQSWRTASISQGTLRRQSATACNSGGRSLTTQACCCSCPPSTSNAVDWTGEVAGAGDASVQPTHSQGRQEQCWLLAQCDFDYKAAWSFFGVSLAAAELAFRVGFSSPLSILVMCFRSAGFHFPNRSSVTFFTGFCLHLVV